MSKSKNVVKKLTTILFTILFTLLSVFAIGPTNVNAGTTDITEIKLTGDYQYGTVPAGILPSFNPATTTDSITIDKTNSGWKYKMESGGWSGFGSETPVAYNDGKTDYGYCFAVETKTEYQLASDLKVVYNGVDVTSSVRVLKYAWGGYVTVDLGKAIGENPTTHTVTFNSNGGTEIAPKEVVSGVKIKAPSTPTKDKYLFRGWYEDSTFSKKFDFNTPITDNITLYAKWEAANSINEIRLAGDFQYGTVPVGTLPSFNPGTTTDSITIDRTNSGWKYKMESGGWSGFGSETPVAYNDGKTDYGYCFAVETKTEYQLASDLKVVYNGVDVTSTVDIMKASWGAYVTVDLGKAIGTPVVYTITFNSNDGTSVAPQNVNAGEKLTEPTPAPTKVGFTFDGWYEDSTFSKKFNFNTPITDNMTLYAKWTENKYTLTFDANGGSGTMTPKADLTGEYTLPANEFTAPSGKQFKGWSLTTDGAIVTKVAMTENRTVYAIWENIPVVTYTVSFAANGGTGTMADVTGISGEYTLPANGFTAPDGKRFKAWSVGGVEKAAGDKITVTANTTVTAIWENIPVVTYTVSFAANGGTGTMADVTGVSGEYTLPANGFTAPAGKQFKAWSVGGVEKAAGDKITVTANTTVTAIWEAIEYNVTVTGGTASVGAGTPITKATMGTTVTLTANAAPSGKVFDKWVVVSGGITLADANSATTTFTMPASAVSVKATYKNAPHTHTYNQETVKPEALKTPADCTRNAVYFKSCSCGAISTTDTFVAMNTALHHAYGSDWKYDSTNHWHECSRCHDKKNEAAHTASDWIIDTPATATTAGTKHKECTVCHRVLETQTIPSTGTIEYNITVTDGKATVGAGTPITKATMGTTVTLTANAAPSGKVFDEWEVVSGGITLADVNSATTTFTMHASAVSVKATYKNAPHTPTPTPTHTHNLTLVAAKAATCTEGGKEAYYKCEGCGKFYEDVLGTKEITDLASWGNIAKIALTTKLNATSLTYNGKVRTPKVIVKDETGKTLVKNTDYTVSYAKGRKYVGKYAVKITFKGKYSGTKTLYFTIKPKATSISSLKAGSKKFTVKWKKQATQTTGYQVQYSASSEFSKAKTVTVGKNRTVSKKISKLSGKKKYYVRVRTYKTVEINGKSIRIYSDWSKAETVTTKK